jgi:hypothetical protein
MENTYKCHACHTFFDEKFLKEGKCPVCGAIPEKNCPLDHLCKCHHDINAGVKLCPTCGRPTCDCGSHDVVVISRVTGYLSDVSGWNEAKKQELKDRNRVII